MESIKFVVRIPENHEVTVKVPDRVAPNQTAEVTVKFRGDRSAFEERVGALQAARHDELFLSDLRAVAEDFAAIDRQESEHSHGV